MQQRGFLYWLLLFALPEVLAGIGLGVLLLLTAYVWRLLPPLAQPVIFEDSARLHALLLPLALLAYLLLGFLNRRWIQTPARTPEGQAVQTPYRQSLLCGYVAWLKAQIVLGAAWWFWQGLGYPVGAPPGHYLDGLLLWITWFVLTLLLFASLFVRSAPVVDTNAASAASLEEDSSS